MSKHDSGKLASDEEVARNDYDTRDVIHFQESDPVSTDGTNRWQQAIDAWVAKNHANDPQYQVPSEKSNYTYGDWTGPTPTPYQTVLSNPTPTP
jgi:hypothetical protein